MIRTSGTSYRLVAAAAVLAVALVLSGCGRKGPLDAPPGGLVEGAQVSGEPVEGEDAPGEVVRRGGARGLPVIRGPNKPIPLDALLN